jgi:hypothetical protein
MSKIRKNSLSSEQDQINIIKHITYCSKETMIQMSAIDALGAHGKPAINAISELINCSSIDKEVKTHALSVIQSIKNNL